MSGLIKKTLVIVLRPFACISNKLDTVRRLWANARLSSALGGKIDTSIVVLNMPELHGTRQVSLGKNLYLYRDLYWETQEHGRIEIGDNVVLSRGVHLVSFAEVILEDGVMVGEYASIRDANHEIVAGHSVRYTGHTGKPIRICRNAWLGRGVTILAGVTIGEGAVIGANAVVTKDIPAGAVAVGVPAKVIKS
jgi:acetyltransferase-like isoleucine patch superfamily enzyme